MGERQKLVLAIWVGSDEFAVTSHYFRLSHVFAEVSTRGLPKLPQEPVTLGQHLDRNDTKLVEVTPQKTLSSAPHFCAWAKTALHFLSYTHRDWHLKGFRYFE